MHNNRNKKALRRVKKGMMNANHTRNIFAILAVALTTFMITTVFSLGINYKENMDLMEIRSSGTNADVMLAMPTAEQEKEIRSLDYVNTIGIQYMSQEKMRQTATLQFPCSITTIQNGKNTIKKPSAI